MPVAYTAMNLGAEPRARITTSFMFAYTCTCTQPGLYPDLHNTVDDRKGLKVLKCGLVIYICQALKGFLVS